MEIHRCYPAAIVQAAFLTNVSARAQDTTTDGYVTRKEYDELKAELLAMKKELDALKKEKGAVSNRGASKAIPLRTHIRKSLHGKRRQKPSHRERRAFNRATGSIIVRQSLPTVAGVAGTHGLAAQNASTQRSHYNECQVPGRQK